jgi:hypothetical protein
MRAERRRAVGPLLIGVLAAAASCRPREIFPKAPVIVLSIDTLRADHLPAYGYAKVSTPALDAFRKDAVLYENAYSHVPLTLPSHATLLTGLLPPQNGVRDNTGYALARSHETLPERLRRSGYATGAAVSAVVMTKTSGVDRGFDFYEDSVEATSPGQPLGAIQRSGFETERIAEEWIGGREGKPFFFLLHLYEPHTPYRPPEPYASRYPDSPYDGEIATADAIAGKFFAFLKARGLYDSSVIVVMSDHGEGLGDHGEDEHGLLLYREDLHVPLVVKLPGAGRAGTRVARPVGRRGSRDHPCSTRLRPPARSPARSTPRRSFPGITSGGVTWLRSRTTVISTSTGLVRSFTTSWPTRRKRRILLPACRRRFAPCVRECSRCPGRARRREPRTRNNSRSSPRSGTWASPLPRKARMTCRSREITFWKFGS